jgi:hypothetical protein
MIKKKNGNYMKKILTGMFIFLVLFTCACLFIAYKTESEPKTLITCVFAFCSVEGGLSAWIKNCKDKRKTNGNEYERKTENSERKMHDCY